MKRGWLALAFAAWLALPWLPGVPLFLVSQASLVGIGALVALGLVVLTGVAGITSFGQASFMGFGAYATALLCRAGYSPWLGLPAALAASLAAALVIGVSTLRLQGHFLAVASIAWSVSLYFLAGNLDVTGRYDGISGLPAPSIAGLTFADGRAYHALVWLAVLAGLLATRNLLDSRWGRAVRSLRGGGLAAAAFGVPVWQARLLAFCHAALLAGLAGWLYAHWQRAVNPTPFGLSASIEYLLMAVTGGAAHLGGALLGALLVTVVRDRLQDVLALFGTAANLEPVIFGALLVLLLQTAPEGLWPHLARRRTPRRAIADAPPLPRGGTPARAEPVLDVDALTKRFGGLVAVNGVSFSVAAGEIVGLIGPNGAGKSTTFNLLTGVLRPSAGHVRFLGRPIAGLAPPRVARLRIARSFQHVNLPDGMTVIEAVAIGAHARSRAGPLAAAMRLDRRDEARLFAEAARQLDRVGLRAEADRVATTLALGQQRIVEVARALCLDPVLLLLDEPAAGLRHAEKQALAALLSRLRDDGVSVLLVEHDMGFVMGLADRLVVMDFGTRIADGAPAAVASDPAVIEAYLGASA